MNYLFRETRFFVIKSNNADNVWLSKSKGVCCVVDTATKRGQSNNTQCTASRLCGTWWVTPNCLGHTPFRVKEFATCGQSYIAYIMHCRSAAEFSGLSDQTILLIDAPAEKALSLYLLDCWRIWATRVPCTCARAIPRGHRTVRTTRCHTKGTKKKQKDGLHACTYNNHNIDFVIWMTFWRTRVEYIIVLMPHNFF